MSNIYDLNTNGKIGLGNVQSSMWNVILMSKRNFKFNFTALPYVLQSVTKYLRLTLVFT